MPPHCDSMDGPVVTAARAALEGEDVGLVLPYVAADGEEEILRAFDLAIKARTQGPEARIVADRFFFETVVRVHRAGEGAPFTGLKPSGLDVGPAIPIAERAIASDSPEELIAFLVNAVQTEIVDRFELLRDTRRSSDESVAAAREYVNAQLGLQVWSHKLYKQIKVEHRHL